MVVRAPAKRCEGDGPAQRRKNVGQHAAKMAALDNAHGDEGRAQVSLSTAQKIQQARMARGLTQKQLAQAINEKPANIVSASCECY